MERYLGPLGAAFLCLLGFAALTQTQERSIGTMIFDAVRPFVVEAASVIISAAVLWLVGTVKRKFNIDIDAKQRDALQAALTNAAGLIINRAGGVAAAIAIPAGSSQLRLGVDYVIESAPEALKHFGITPESVSQVLAEKLGAKIGVLASTGAAGESLTRTGKQPMSNRDDPPAMLPGNYVLRDSDIERIVLRFGARRPRMTSSKRWLKKPLRGRYAHSCSKWALIPTTCLGCVRISLRCDPSGR